MNRARFLKASTALVAGGVLSPLLSCADKAEPTRTNWARNYQYKAPHFLEPKSVEELQTLLKKSGQYKALGSRHSFNDVADSPGTQLSTRYLDKVLDINGQALTLTVEAGARYGQFAPLLHQKGYALHNLASLPHISVGGACATATHGSGIKNGNLATAVLALNLITPNGELVTLSRAHDGDLFKGAVVGLGALGVVTSLTLKIQPTFQVRQDVFQDLPLAMLKAHFDEILASGYSVSLFTDWQQERISQVWVKRRVEADTGTLGADFFGAKAATRNLHPITRLSAETCTEQLGIPGPWHERLPHFKMGFTPGSGDELQTEYVVPYPNALDALLALEKMGDLLTPHLLISEIRTIAADDFWMSPCHRQDCVSFHFTWKPDWLAVKELLPKIEAELAPFKARPHWGKLFKTDADSLKEQYEMIPEFLQLARLYDPRGKFRNGFLDMNVYAR